MSYETVYESVVQGSVSWWTDSEAYERRVGSAWMMARTPPTGGGGGGYTSSPLWEECPAALRPAYQTWFGDMATNTTYLQLWLRSYDWHDLEVEQDGVMWQVVENGHPVFASPRRVEVFLHVVKLLHVWPWEDWSEDVPLRWFRWYRQFVLYNQDSAQFVLRPPLIGAAVDWSPTAGFMGWAALSVPLWRTSDFIRLSRSVTLKAQVLTQWLVVEPYEYPRFRIWPIYVPAERDGAAVYSYLCQEWPLVPHPRVYPPHALNSRQMLATMVPTRSWEELPSLGPLRPLYQSAEQRHYPLPPECRVAALTGNQAQALLFMLRQESTSFIHQMGSVVEHRGGVTPPWAAALPQCLDHALVTPWARTCWNPCTTAEWQEALPLTGGILSNSVGSGKTLLALVIALLRPTDHTLIVVPDTHLTHWVSEVQKHTTLALRSRKRTRDAEELPTAEVLVWSNVAEAREWDRAMPRLLLVTHHVLRMDAGASRLRLIPWTRVMVDEAHKMGDNTLLTLMDLPRPVTWLLSGTPDMDLLHRKQLQLERLFRVLRMKPESDTSSSLFMYRHLTFKEPEPRRALEVEMVKELCSPTPEEQLLLEDIGQLLETELFQPQVAAASNLHRFFRIMERLGAGGYIHRRLVLAVLRQLFQQQQQGGEKNEEARTPAPRTAYMAAGDDCTICLCPFTDPVQLACGHVFCALCAQVMVTAKAACAWCRQPHVSFHTPHWPGTEAAAAAAVVDVELVVPYREVRQGSSLAQSAEEWVFLGGKAAAVEAAVTAWVQRAPPTEQIVIFFKEGATAVMALTALDRHHLPTLQAGTPRVGRSESLAAIERFRQGEGRVLLLHVRYCEGFDLFQAREVWLLNTDIKVSRMDQSMGRVQRLVQAHPKVTVRIFVYPRAFDEFIWDHRDRFQASNPYRWSHILQFYHFSQRHHAGTRAHTVTEIVKLLYPEAPAPQASGRTRLEWGPLMADLDVATVSVTHYFSIPWRNITGALLPVLRRSIRSALVGE